MKMYEKYLGRGYSFVGMHVKRNLSRLLRCDRVVDAKHLEALLHAQGWSLTPSQIKLLDQY